jgi:hypothetical protein
VPTTCAPFQRLPRASCNWRGLVQRAQWRYRACGPGGRRQRVVAPQALRPQRGREGCVESGRPWPRVPLPGVSRPGFGAQGLGAGGGPQQPAWSVGGKQGLREANSGVPFLALSGPAIHERTGSPARVALSAARAGACVSEERFSCRTARERARCGECGGERRGAAAHPLLPLRTRRRPEERAGRA